MKDLTLEGDPTKNDHNEEADLENPKLRQEETSSWKWNAPDLREGDGFYCARLKKLKEVTHTCGDPEWIEKGNRF